MTAAVAPGTPAAPVASPAPGVADAGAAPITPEGVVGPAPEGDDGDPEVARKKAREILFAPDEMPVAEVKPTPKPAVEEKDDIALSKKWAKVSAQEDRLVERQKKTATLEATLKEREAALTERESLHQDPIAFLTKAGWSKDKIVEWIQSDGKIDPELMVKQLDERYKTEIQKLREEREQERTQLEEQRRERAKSEIEGQLNDEVMSLTKSDAELGVLKRLVEKNPKKFEPFIQKRVGEIIQQVWRKTFNKGEHEGTNKGQVVDPLDALKYLQSELAELQLADPGQAPAVKPATPVAVEPTPITNQATSQRTVHAPPDYDEMDPEARRARAKQIFEAPLEDDEE